MKLSWHSYRLVLREPLRISRSVMAHREAVRLTVTHDGLTGHGEVVTSGYYGLDRAAIERTCAGWTGRLAGCPGPAALRDELSTFDGPAGVLAALDTAVHDLLGKARGLPVHRLLAAPAPTPVATAYTIGLVPVADAAATARRLVAAGFAVLKVKAGDDADVARVAAVRAEAPTARLLLDPNGGWSAEQAVRRLDALTRYRIDAVEQPIPPGRPDLLARVAARTAVPVVADEDAERLADLDRLTGAVAGVNVKLAKCGGIAAATRIVDAARERGLDIMLGCLVASTLGVAPAVHLAGLARWVDLDGHLLIADDPWTGIGGHDGVLRLADTPGLGVTPAATTGSDRAVADRPGTAEAAR